MQDNIIARRGQPSSFLPPPRPLRPQTTVLLLQLRVLPPRCLQLLLVLLNNRLAAAVYDLQLGAAHGLAVLWFFEGAYALGLGEVVVVVVVAVVVDLVEVELVDRFFRRRGLQLQVYSLREALPLPPRQLQLEGALGQRPFRGFAVGGGAHLAALHLLRYVMFAACALELLRLVLRLAPREGKRGGALGRVVGGLPGALGLRLLAILTVGVLESHLHEFDSRMRQVVLIIAVAVVVPAFVVEVERLAGELPYHRCLVL